MKATARESKCQPGRKRETVLTWGIVMSLTESRKALDARNPSGCCRVSLDHHTLRFPFLWTEDEAQDQRLGQGERGEQSAGDAPERVGV